MVYEVQRDVQNSIQKTSRICDKLDIKKGSILTSQIGMEPGVRKSEHSMVDVADYFVVNYILLKFNSHKTSQSPIRRPLRSTPLGKSGE